jgi:hypothetical protein
MRFVMGFLLGVCIAAIVVAAGYDQEPKLMPDTIEDLVEEAPDEFFTAELTG